MGGQRFPGFEIEPGIKQGCPASGSIFALSLDPIVRALVCALPEPESCLCGFADELMHGSSDLFETVPNVL
eukprot:1964356-Pyramimonas_sp.AAC.1